MGFPEPAVGPRTVRLGRDGQVKRNGMGDTSGVTENRDADASRLAAAAYARGEPTGWFEALYEEAVRGRAIVPWDSADPNSFLVEWAAARDGTGRRAVVVGSGLGRDAEFVARLGYRTTGFDLSATAVRAARERHPGSSVSYEVANLLDLPERYRQAFDLVVESYTVQSLPDPPRADAIAAVRTLVARGGTLLVIAMAREPDEQVSGPPFPLTRAELDAFAGDELAAVAIEHRNYENARAAWIAEFTRP
jgi:SAM-dependent methyltransferase